MLLVIEDSDDDFFAFRRAVRKHEPGLAIARCSNANEARTHLKAVAEGQADRPELVFLDLNLPGASGKALLREIKLSAQLRDLRVVVYSTSDSPSDIRYCYSNWANAYHTKPLDADRMREELWKIIQYWRSLARPSWLPSASIAPAPC